MRGDGDSVMTASPSRPEARRRFGSQSANELGAPVASSPHQQGRVRKCSRFAELTASANPIALATKAASRTAVRVLELCGHRTGGVHVPTAALMALPLSSVTPSADTKARDGPLNVRSRFALK
jgi:hypothetical protein